MLHLDYQVVYKYPLKVAGLNTLILPKGFSLISFKWLPIDRCFVLYALHPHTDDPFHNESEQVKVYMVMTGETHPFLKKENFIGTDVSDHGIVAHAFKA